MRYPDPPTSHPPTRRRQLTLRLLVWAVGFCAIESAVVGSLMRSADSDVAASIVVGIMVSAYLLAAFIVIAQPFRKIGLQPPTDELVVPRARRP